MQRRSERRQGGRGRLRGLRNMSSGVEPRVLDRIAAAQVLREPFAHCIIDGIFPADFYESIVDEWPEEASWRPLAESGRVLARTGSKPYAERLVVLMNEPDLARLDVHRYAFWRHEVGDWLLGRPLRRVLL